MTAQLPTQQGGEVDVLAVLRQIANGDGIAEWTAMLARDAVAELIEAIKENRAATEIFAQDGMPSNYIRFDQSERRLLKAIARVGGAA